MATFLENVSGLLKFLANFIKGSLIALYYMLKALVLFFVPKCLRFKDVSNDIVLITGGASGLGRLMAIAFAKRGATVVVWDLNAAGLEETKKMVEELRSKKESVGRCFHYTVDISDRFKVYAAAERVRQEVGHVSILVNNAGIVTGKRFLECRDEQIIKTFDVNTLAHFWVSYLSRCLFAFNLFNFLFCFASLPKSVAALIVLLNCFATGQLATALRCYISKACSLKS